MNIFVTVGTTSFNSMIEALDQFFLGKSMYSVTYQIADGDFIPRSGTYFSRTDNINDYYKDSDVIVTHAGAGTIYALLEMSKKVIAVPNLERIDKHQIDLATYMENNEYILVCWSYDTLPLLFEEVSKFNPRVYEKIDFNKYNEIADFILTLY